MAAALGEDRLLATLHTLIDLLQSEDEPEVARALADLAADLESCGQDAACRKAATRKIATLYQQGMGGFQDIVLQDENGVRPAYRRFDELRQQLYAAVIQSLG